MEPPTVSVNVGMGQVVKWLYVLAVQRNRIENFPDGALIFQEEADLHFLLVALRNFVQAVRLVNRLAQPEQSALIQQGLTDFLQAVPNALNLRDVLEHFDVYLFGEGNLQAPRGPKKRGATPANPLPTLWVSRTAESTSISVAVPSFETITIVMEEADAAAQRLVSVVDHALD